MTLPRTLGSEGGSQTASRRKLLLRKICVPSCEEGAPERAVIMCNLCPSVMNGVLEVCSAHRASICGALEVCSHQYPGDAPPSSDYESPSESGGAIVCLMVGVLESVWEGLGRVCPFHKKKRKKKKRVEERKKKKKQKLLLSLPDRPRDIFLWWR